MHTSSSSGAVARVGGGGKPTGTSTSGRGSGGGEIGLGGEGGGATAARPGRHGQYLFAQQSLIPLPFIHINDRSPATQTHQ